MNDAPAPLPPDEVDELLSAELDGAFDAAAADLGLAPDVARARLGATPGVGSRRVSIARSREALGAVDPVDELLQQRLVAKSLRAYDDRLAIRRMERSRRSRQLMSAAAIAAAILVVVGVIAAVRGGSSSSNKASSSSPSTAHSTPAPASASAGRQAATPSPNPNYGDVSSGSVLRQRVLDTLHAQFAAGPTGTQDQVSKNASGAAAATPDPCRAQLAAIAGSGDALQFTATGTVNGAPVRILVFLQAGGSHVVFVTTGDCRIVNEQVLAPR
jgi:hypothetical protein